MPQKRKAAWTCKYQPGKKAIEHAACVPCGLCVVFVRETTGVAVQDFPKWLNV